MGKLPAFQFYPGDWMKDAALRSVGFAARGLYIDLLCLMWECPERGYLKSGNQIWNEKQIRTATGANAFQLKTLLRVLLKNGVLSKRESDGAIYSRRMVREELERTRWRESKGKKAADSRLFPADFPPISRDIPGASSSSTSSTTPKEGKTKNGAIAPLAEWIPLEAWGAWREMRQKTRKPLTERAVDIAIRKLARFRAEGHDIRAIIEEATLNCWMSFYAPRQAGGKGAQDANARSARTTANLQEALRRSEAGDSPMAEDRVRELPPRSVH